MRALTALHTLEMATGIVIPTYFHADTAPALAYDLLSTTVQLFAREVADPQAICLSVDGSPLAATIAQQIGQELGVQVVVSTSNRGKLSAARNGMAHLLQDPRWQLLAMVDQDGDHFANELLNLVRAAQHVIDGTATTQLLVLGSRLSRHRPLGFLRGEQEELANRMLLDALNYWSAVNDRPIAWQYANGIEDLPDFHSGYKLFSRTSAQAVFLGEAQLAGCSEAAYYRHGVEAVMTVEAMISGATFAAVNRRTYDEQPISVFARMDRSQLAADMIIWPCKRLGVPGHFVEQWLTNHLHRSLLATLAPQGRDELLAIRNLVLQAFDRPLPQDPVTIARALFV